MVAEINIDVSAAHTRRTNRSSIKWDHHEAVVKKLQVRIAKAVKLGKYNKAKSLQWILTHSFSAKVLAVKKVTQNAGGKTPGVDGIILSTLSEKMEMANSLKRRGYKPLPVRRILIPKTSGKGKRPLGIPTVKDRCMQTLHAMGLIPVAEATADLNSYGFRPERSCADAIEQTFYLLAKQTSFRWILEGDIKGCFDNISHAWMLENCCTDTVILERWLKAGYVQTKKLFPTNEGTPQGSPISTILCNMTLDGLETRLAKIFPKKKGVRTVNFVRYADDFIVVARTPEKLEEVIPVISSFLKERGLELSNDKTKITSIYDGFDFLGQNVRKYTVQGKDKLLIKPSKKGIKKCLTSIREKFRSMPQATQINLIANLNPMLMGWANYHRSIVSKKVFQKIDYEVWRLCWSWAMRRHSDKGKKWIGLKYFKFTNRTQTFQGLYSNKEWNKDEVFRIFEMGKLKIKRHNKIFKKAQPYDKAFDQYYENRISLKWKDSRKIEIIGRMIAKQGALCPSCEKYLSLNQKWRINLIKRSSNGGLYKPQNMRIIHQTCHQMAFGTDLCIHS